ncbi:MAG: class I SAM-dependent methyltransferase [Promethearchaeota archaeon]
MINDSIRNLNQYYDIDKTKFTKINRILNKIRFHKILYLLAGQKLKKLSSKCKSIEDYLNLLASFRFSIFNLTSQVLLWSMQRKSEITSFCKIIAKFRPKTVLEIGTANGGTLFLLARFSAPKALILSIDLRGEKKSNRGIFYNSFAIDKQKIVYLERSSHETSTLLELKKRLKNRKVNLLFIDGDHSYEGVKKDFEMYSPLVKKNGIIGFHDIVKVSPDRFPDVEVNKFWNEIKNSYEFIEIVEDWDQGWGGIGLINMK